jgi:hypothetical protein
MSDRLTLTRALEGSGMQSDAAERIATEIYDAIHDNVATKTDLARALDRPSMTGCSADIRDYSLNCSNPQKCCRPIAFHRQPRCPARMD